MTALFPRINEKRAVIEGPAADPGTNFCFHLNPQKQTPAASAAGGC
jgi:hypothetical protein